ncbi:MAG: CRISPR-associated protein Cas5, partial [Planctomycetota bacterium]
MPSSRQPLGRVGRPRRSRSARRAFPLPLYATLLGALCCVFAPAVPRPVQAWLQRAMCLPLRAFGSVAAAADGTVAGRGRSAAAARSAP